MIYVPWFLVNILTCQKCSELKAFQNFFLSQRPEKLQVQQVRGTYTVYGLCTDL